MNKIKFILMVISIPLLVSCEKCFLCWDCVDVPIESYIHFDNTDKYNIAFTGRSSYTDHLDDDVFRPGTGYCVGSERLTGVEMLKLFKRDGDEGFLLEGDTIKDFYFILFMNRNKEVVLVWDLRDTTQRWADESQWTMDSSFHEICYDDIQVQYHNTYTFSDEDFE